MKKILCVSLLLILCLSLFACGNEKSDLPVKTLNVYNWGQYISDGSGELPNINDWFEEYFNENLAEEYGYEIRVNYSTYPSNEDMHNKLVSRSANFDVIIPSDYMVERLIKENQLVALDFDLLPNYENIMDEFKTTYNTYDPDAKYSVPYTYNMFGIIYNTDYVDEEDTGSWDLLWNEKYKGKILQINNPRDGMGTAMYSLGYSVNTTDRDKWREATDLLIEQKPLVQAYVMDEIFGKMISGSAYIAPYYPGDFLTMYDSNDSLAFYYPEEGTNFFVDAMCIPTCAKNVEAAHAYINFMMDEEPATANAEYIGYACPNKLVQQNEEYIEYMTDWHEDAMEILYGTEAIVDDYTDLGQIESDKLKTSFYRAQDTDTLAYTNDLWSELKIESAVEPWIIVTDCVIVAALVAWGVFAFVRKKRREKDY